MRKPALYFFMGKRAERGSSSFIFDIFFNKINKKYLTYVGTYDIIEI